MSSSPSTENKPRKTEQAPAGIQYYGVVKHWARIRRHLNDSELNRVLVADFNKFTFGRWRLEFKPGMFPADFESCYWRLGIRGRHPAYYRYVKHAACHWLCNFNLRLAMLVDPNRSWRIVTSDVHSTVWDGAQTLFDLNFLALRVSARYAWTLASANGTELPVGQYMETHFTPHYTEAHRIAA